MLSSNFIVSEALIRFLKVNFTKDPSSSFVSTASSNKKIGVSLGSLVLGSKVTIFWAYEICIILPEAKCRRINFVFPLFFYSSSSWSEGVKPGLNCPSTIGLPTVAFKYVALRLELGLSWLPYFLGYLAFSFLEGVLDLAIFGSSGFSSKVLISSISHSPSKISVWSGSSILFLRKIKGPKL